jgi:hypothetical protein
MIPSPPFATDLNEKRREIIKEWIDSRRIEM